MNLIAFVALIWLAYLAGRWEKKQAQQQASDAEWKSVEVVLQGAYKAHAQHGDYKAAWNWVICILHPGGVPMPPDPYSLPKS